jgi:hypothetical protein
MNTQSLAHFVSIVRRKSPWLALTLALFLLAGGLLVAYGLPLIDKIANTGGAAVKVYPDRDDGTKYWYIPVSVEPWTRDNQFKSQLYVAPDKSKLTFIFRGQASVDDDTLTNVAKALNVPKANLSPIAYDSTQNLVCQNVFVGEKLQWVWPPRIGGYLEVVPISLRTTDPGMVDELQQLITGGGLGCTVDLQFRAVYTAYEFTMKADLDSVYDRFQAAAHAEGLWWEVDLNALIEKLEKDGVITFEKYEDPNAPKTPLDDMAKAAVDDILHHIVAEMFTPSLKLPTGDIVGRGKPWSLRVDYRHSEEHKHYKVLLKSEQVSLKSSTIGIRMALGANNLERLTKPPSLPAGLKTNKAHLLSK